MIFNKFVTDKTFFSLIEMFSREGFKVRNKICDKNFKSFVIESEQYIFTDDFSSIGKNIIIEKDDWIIKSEKLAAERKFSQDEVIKKLLATGWEYSDRVTNREMIELIKYLDTYYQNVGKLKDYVIIKFYKTTVMESSVFLQFSFKVPRPENSWLNLPYEALLSSSTVYNKDPDIYYDNIIKGIDHYLQFNPRKNKAGKNDNSIESVKESFVGKQVDAKEYIEHHGRKPSGHGKWIFGIGSRNEKDWFSFDGSFTDARNAAYAVAEKRGVKKIYVMEDFKFEYFDIKFKIIKENDSSYRVSMLIDGDEKYVTKTITEKHGKQICSKWLAEELNIRLEERKKSVINKDKKENIVGALKKKIKDFRERYGENAKNVMYATANKLANESLKEDTNTYFDKGEKPFKTKSAAEKFRIDNQLDITHTVAPISKIIDDKFVTGYIVRPRQKKTVKESSMEDTNIGRKWFDRDGNEIEVEFEKDGKYYTKRNGSVNLAPIIPADQLERTIKVDTSWYQKKLRDDEELANQEKMEIQARDAKNKEYASISGRSKLDTGRRIAALDKKRRISTGEILTIKQLIDREIKNGAKIEIHNFWNDKLGKSVPEEILISSDGTYRDVKDIGKTGMDYAKEVLNTSTKLHKENMKRNLEKKLSMIIEEESFKELDKEPVFRHPYKAVKTVSDFESGWKVVDNLNQALSGIYTEEDAKNLVELLNSHSEVVTFGIESLNINGKGIETIKDRSLPKGVGKKLKESSENFGRKSTSTSTTGKKETFGRKSVTEEESSIKTFKIKYEKVTDSDEKINGEKEMTALDSSTARTRFMEDNKTGFKTVRIVSITEI